jgi:hypothetical protein
MSGIPDYDSTSELSAGVPDLGHHDVSLTACELTESKAGNDMLVFTFVIDNGEALGIELKDYAALDLQSQFGEKKAKAIAAKARWRWPSGLKSRKEWAESFIQDPPLRLGVMIKHDLSIEVDDSWKNGVSQEDWEAHDGRKNKKGVIDRYVFAQDEPEWQPSSNDAGSGTDSEVPF